MIQNISDVQYIHLPPQAFVRGVDGHHSSVAAESWMQIDPENVPGGCGCKFREGDETLRRDMIQEQVLVALGGIRIGYDPIAARPGNIADVAVLVGLKEPVNRVAASVVPAKIIASAI